MIGRLIRKTVKTLLALLIILLIWVGWQFLPPPSPPPLPAGYHPQKAVWLDITWSMDAHSDAETQALAQHLQAHEITTVFAYVSYLKPGDFFNPTFDHAQHFVEQMHVLAPGITLLAWVGVPIHVTTPDGLYIENRLTDPKVQNTIADFSRQVVEDLGFDGIHLNAEPVADGNTAYIDTLQAIRSQMPSGAILSVAGLALYPTEAITIVQYPKTEYRWSADYLKIVAENSDQIPMMDYDSGLFFPSDYRGWMAYQVRASAAVLAQSHTELFIGVPASEEQTPSHQVTTEYLANALYGVRLGISQSQDYEAITGIAVYPYWEISDGEWALLDDFS
ncbi:MAG: hypothetical protein ABI690_26640 [Chloroflexota bacterium]